MKRIRNKERTNKANKKQITRNKRNKLKKRNNNTKTQTTKAKRYKQLATNNKQQARRAKLSSPSFIAHPFPYLLSLCASFFPSVLSPLPCRLLFLAFAFACCLFSLLPLFVPRFRLCDFESSSSVTNSKRTMH